MKFYSSQLENVQKSNTFTWFRNDIRRIPNWDLLNAEMKWNQIKSNKVWKRSKPTDDVLKTEYLIYNHSYNGNVF